MIIAAAAVLAAAVLTGCGSPAEAPTAPVAEAAPKRQAPLPSERAAATATAGFASRGAQVYCGGRAKPWVALTFDDGPGPYTSHVLALLGKYDVPATFFLVGRNVAPHLRVAGRERNRGMAIGNHSWSHPVLTSLTAKAQRQQLLTTNRAISRVTGKPVRLFRPPYEEHDAVTDKITRRMRMATILWNVDSRDSLGASSKVIARRVKRGLTPGSIILMHENHGQTVRALRYTILPALKRSGMRPVTVPQMLAGNPPTRQQLARGRRGCHR